MNKLVYILFYLFVALNVSAKNLRIGLFYAKPIETLKINYNIGRYEVLTNSKIFPVLSNARSTVNVKAINGEIQLSVNNKNLGNFIWLRLNALSPINNLSLFPYGNEIRYRGNIIVYAFKNKLQVVNEIDLEEYIKGVIKGEVGYGYNIEYYKVQSVISRTYSLKLHKHTNEGYDLCDHTHCQVYKGINYDDDISAAVDSTKGLVLIDANLNYLNTLFHSNCGGQTVTTDYVWTKKLSGLNSVQDSFCRNSSQANWKKVIPKVKWQHFVLNKLNIPENKIANYSFNFTQYNRKKYYQIRQYKIKLTDIRAYFKLKSTYFSVTEVGNNVVLIGKGYGHGVGLCQEGAIEMQKKGYSFKDILMYYYNGVSLMTINDLNYFLLF